MTQHEMTPTPPREAALRRSLLIGAVLGAVVVAGAVVLVRAVGADNDTARTTLPAQDDGVGVMSTVDAAVEPRGTASVVIAGVTITNLDEVLRTGEQHLAALTDRAEADGRSVAAPADAGCWASPSTATMVCGPILISGENTDDRRPWMVANLIVRPSGIVELDPGEAAPMYSWADEHSGDLYRPDGSDAPDASTLPEPD